LLQLGLQKAVPPAYYLPACPVLSR
jgi:hypothetical protein